MTLQPPSVIRRGIKQAIQLGLGDEAFFPAELADGFSRGQRLARQGGGGVIAQSRNERGGQRQALLDQRRATFGVGLEARHAAAANSRAARASRSIDWSRL